jgi:UDP-glucose 4-epimerase
VRAIGKALGRPARLVPVPVAALRGAARLGGKRAAVDRLVGDLEVDDGATRRILGWRAPYTAEEGLARTAAWFRAPDAPA